MLNKEEIAHYSKQLILPGLGIEGQEKIKNAKVLVVGLGGLGCSAALYLTAMGVGKIGVLDFDTVEVSNLQRQVLYSLTDIGLLKAEVAFAKLSFQNPFVKISKHAVKLDNKNALDIFTDYDIIIDGTDNYAARYLINDACILLNKILIYGAIYKFEGQVSVFNLKTHSVLESPTYRCLFPIPAAFDKLPNCSEIGVVGFLPGIIGTLQATEAIKIITGLGEPLSGKLLLFNALSSNFQTIEFSRNNNWIDIAPKNNTEFIQMDYEYFCKAPDIKLSNESISIDELKFIIDNKIDIQLIDVREPFEYPQIHEFVDLHIPLSEIYNKLHLISDNKKVIVYCNTGLRSKRAITILEKEFGFSNLHFLDGGALEWIKNFPN